MSRLRPDDGALSPFAAGSIAVVIVLVAVFFAFTKANPFASPYELQAVFEGVQNLKGDSPVRVAGVDVGKVTTVEPLDDGSGRGVVTMEIQESGLPVHEDARLQIRPRLFLEGNFFVDLKPGSPSAPELPSESRVDVAQTASSVSFEQVLKVLDKDTRQSLRTLLDEFATGLEKGGARGFNDSIPFWKPAYRATALANDALLGEEPGDLRRLVRGQARLSRALVSDRRALQDLVSNLNTTTAAFAREDDALEASIPALRDVVREGLPALASLNAALPSVRAFARDALPGVRTTPETVDVVLPFVRQLSALVARDELPRLARDLRRAIPDLARLNSRTVGFLQEARALSSCTSDVLVPTAREPVPDPDFPEADGEPLYQDGPRSFVGLAGESRIGDANGQLFRVQVGGGPNTLVETGPLGEPLLFQNQFPSLGARPAPTSRPPFRPDVPCETQEPPDLEAGLAPPEGGQTQARGGMPRDAKARRVLRRELGQAREELRQSLGGNR